MKEITIKLYLFSELSPEVQAKVLDKNRDINVDHDWFDNTIDEWKEKLSSFGFMDSEIYFSGFGSQGDGACFDAIIDLETILHHKDTPKEYVKLILGKSFFTVYIDKCSNSNYYSHENTRYIGVDNDIKDKYVKSQDLLDSFIHWLDILRISLSKQIYSELSKEYDYLVSDEAVKETIISNEYTFESNGTMRNE